MDLYLGLGRMNLNNKIYKCRYNEYFKVLVGERCDD